MLDCRLCGLAVEDDMYLSDGRVIHEACLTQLEKNREEIESTLQRLQIQKANQKAKLSQLKDEIRRRDGITFAILSLFAPPRIATEQIQEDILIVEKDIENLSIKLSSLSTELPRVKSKLTSIYDYYLTYPPDWSERRQQVVNRDGEQCSVCGNYYHLHLHHVSPLSKGGSNKIFNLKVLCKDCHSKVHGGRDFSGVFTPSESAFSRQIAAIRSAANRGKKITFEYKKPSDKSYLKRVVLPYGLINMPHRRNYGNTLCVEGFCELRNTDRTFALKRMKQLKIIEI